MEIRHNFHIAVDQEGMVHLYRHYTTKTLCDRDKSYKSGMTTPPDWSPYHSIVTCESCRDMLRIIMLDAADTITGVHQLVQENVDNTRLRMVS